MAINRDIYDIEKISSGLCDIWKIMVGSVVEYTFGNRSVLLCSKTGPDMTMNSRNTYRMTDGKSVTAKCTGRY